MDQKLAIFTLGVNDLKVATDFYENKFGWERSVLSTDSIVFYELNGTTLALYPQKALADDITTSPEGSGFKGFTLAYPAKSEKEVDQLIEQLRRKGVKIVKEPQKVFWGGYSSYVADPDENFWEIAYNPFL